MNNDNQNKSNGKLLFFGGILLGAASAYYLHTNEGKKLSKIIKSTLNTLTKDISDQATSVVEQTKEKSNKIIQNATESLTNLKDTLMEEGDKVVDIAQENLSKFQQGVNIAKDKLNQKTT